MLLYSGLFNKPLAAFGTGDVDFTFPLGNAEGVAAAGALEESEVFALTQSIFLTKEEIADFIPEGKKTLILQSPFFKVSGEHTINAEHQKQHGYRCQQQVCKQV